MLAERLMIEQQEEAQGRRNKKEILKVDSKAIRLRIKSLLVAGAGAGPVNLLANCQRNSQVVLVVLFSTSTCKYACY
jgi:hypothetical protein